MSIAIVIPTINRTDYIIRQLEFYKRFDSDCPLYIADSSSNEQFQKLKDHLRLNKYKFPIYHLPCQGMNDCQAHVTGLREVKEEFVSYVGDDDFQIPETLRKCRDFLASNPDFVACQGRGILIQFVNADKSTQFDIGKYPTFAISGETPEERVSFLMNNYSPLHFGVHRIKSILDAFEQTKPVLDRSFREIVPSLIWAIEGKTRVLDCLGFVRETHPNRYLLPTTLDWTLSDNWRPSLLQSVSIVSTKLSSANGKDIGLSQSTIKGAFLDYLSRYHFINPSRPSAFNHLTNRLRNALDLRQLKYSNLKYFRAISEFEQLRRDLAIQR